LSEIIGVIYPVPSNLLQRIFSGKDVFIKHPTCFKQLKPGHKVLFYAPHEIIVVVPNEDVKRRYEGSLTLKELFIRLKGSDKWVRGSIEAYLEGKRDIKWLIGVIERSGLRGEELRKEIEKMKEGNEEKVKMIEEECRRKGYI
jgi:hypothetical protein